ncbi:hypothetical protein LCGC14_2972580, partial [marine sediment metagenome]
IALLINKVDGDSEKIKAVEVLMKEKKRA